MSAQQPYSAATTPPHRGVAKKLASPPVKRSPRWPSRPFFLEAALGAACAGALGFAAARSWKWGVALALAFLLVGVSHARIRPLALGVLGFTMGVPIVWLHGVTCPTALFVFGAQVPLQYVAPNIVIVITLPIALQRVREGAKVDSALALAIVATLVWTGWNVFEALAGVLDGHGRRVGSELAVTLQYLWLMVAAGGVLTARLRGSRTVLFLTVFAGVATSLLSMLLFLAPSSVRNMVYASGGWAASGRAGFPTTAFLCLLVPVCLALWSGAQLSPRTRWLLVCSALCMVGAVAVSQTRALIVAVTLNVIMVLLASRSRGSGSHAVRFAIAIALILVAGTLAVQLSHSQSLTKLPGALWSRMESMAAFDRDSSVQTRLLTNRVALDRWSEDWRTMVAGEGLGATFDLYLGQGGGVYRTGSAVVDNAWITTLVKSGLVGVVLLAMLVIAMFMLLAKAAKRCSDPVMATVYGTLAISYPAFIVLTTVVSAQLVAQPAAILAITTFAGMASLCINSENRSRDRSA